MLKFVVLARHKKEDYIVDCFGCFRKRYNATRCMNNAIAEDSFSDVYYCIEEVDPSGSYADMEVED